MTPDELRAAIRDARITQRQAAHICGVTLRTVQNWLSGSTPVPLLAEQALRATAIQEPQDAREALEWLAHEQERRIAAMEQALTDERSALEKTRAKIAALMAAHGTRAD